MEFVMFLPRHVATEIKQLVHDLVQGKFVKISRDGRSGRLDATQLQYAINKYGNRLTMPPDSSFEEIEGWLVDTEVLPTWSTEFDLWTADEGKSDLTLLLTISDTWNGIVRIEIDDLRTL